MSQGSPGVHILYIKNCSSPRMWCLKLVGLALPVNMYLHHNTADGKNKWGLYTTSWHVSLDQEFYRSQFVKNRCGKRKKKKLSTKENSRCAKDKIFKQLGSTSNKYTGAKWSEFGHLGTHSHVLSSTNQREWYLLTAGLPKEMNSLTTFCYPQNVKEIN